MTESSEIYNKDELDTPHWLNDDLLTKVLHSCEKDDSIKLKSFKISPASIKGDHYGSVMFRASVEYDGAQKSELQSISMIVKTIPDYEGHKKELLGESNVMETEIGIYTEVLPKFESILSSIGDDTKLGPKCLYHSLTPRKIIIFEDLSPLGYTVLRDRQPNTDEVKRAFLKLAKLHAISYKLNQENPNELKKFCHSFWNVPNISESDFITGGISKFIEALKTQSKLEKYIPYFEAMKPSLIEKCRTSALEYQQQPKVDTLYVMCHGDFHFKNMMFKGNEDVMPLDYQLSHIGSIAYDLIYSIFMLMSETHRKYHKDELISFYFSNFVEMLQRIGFKGKLPKLADLHQMLLQHKHFEIFVLTTFLPVWYGFRSGESDPEAIMTSADHRLKLYMNKEYLAELEELLPKYLHMGYLES